MMVDMNLSRARYNEQRKPALRHNSRIYSRYHRVSGVKPLCLRPTAAIEVRPDKAQVQLQHLLDHTAGRILELQDEMVKRTASGSPAPLTLHCKWGMDGSTGSSYHKQPGVDDHSSCLW